MNFFGKLFKRLFTFILDVIIFFAIVAIVLYLAYANLKFKDIKNSDIVIGTNYQDMTMAELVDTLQDMTSDVDNQSLADFIEIFPSIGDALGVDKENGALADYIDIDTFIAIKFDELSNSESIDSYLKVTLSSLAGGLKFELPNIPIINNVKDLVIFDGLSQLSQSIDTENMTVADLKTNFGIDLLASNEILADLISEETLVSELATTLENNMDNLTLSDVVDITETDGILASLADTKISELSGKIDSLTLNDVVGDTSSVLLSKLGTSKISDFENDFNGLLLGEAMNYTKTNGVWYNGEAPIDNVLVPFAELSFADLSNGYNIKNTIYNLKVSDFYSNDSSSILSLVGENTTIKDLPSSMNTALTSATTQKLMELEILTLSDENKAKLDTLIPTWKDMTLTNLLTEILNKLPTV